MPRSRILTPASSTEIKGQDHSSKLSSLQLTFELPPSAMNSAREASSEAPNSSHDAKISPVSPSMSSLTPYCQPSETVKARRRSSAAQQQQQKEAFALPPPPTRSRRIIHMKPRSQAEGTSTTPNSSSPTKGAAGAGRRAAPANRKQQHSATSVAGKKIARKEAHSRIERRRRSKMNEVFDILKGMIPACTGEMHKLAILQASVDYVSYLKDCITQLQARNELDLTPTTTTAESRPTKRSFYEEAQERDACETQARQKRQRTGDDDERREKDEEDDDVEITDVEATPSPASTPTPILTPTPTRMGTAAVPPPIQPTLDQSTSPAFMSSSLPFLPPIPTTQGARPRHLSVSTSTSMSPSPSPSTPLPPHDRRASLERLLLPHPHPYPAPARTSQGPSRPQLEIDHEVSAALLMLGNGGINTGKDDRNKGDSSGASGSNGRTDSSRTPTRVLRVQDMLG